MSFQTGMLMFSVQIYVCKMLSNNYLFYTAAQIVCVRVKKNNNTHDMKVSK